MRKQLDYFITDSEICDGPIIAAWCNYTAEELYASEEEIDDWPEDYAMVQLMENGTFWVIINAYNFERDLEYMFDVVDILKKYGYEV